MKALKPIGLKKSSKEDRKKQVLIGLVDCFLKSGKPVGSETLKDIGFPDLSSATIRNYFADLEEENLLVQHHASGGRIPTDKAFRVYALFCLEEKKREHPSKKPFSEFIEEPMEMNGIVHFLQEMTETVSKNTQMAAFLSAPRFDQDFVVDMKVVGLDPGRYLTILITHFGLIHTEVLHAEKKLSSFDLKRIESYFRSRLSIEEKVQEELTQEELAIAHRFYQEAMARYLVSYSNFTEEDICQAGFSSLLNYPEFHDARALTSALSLFENSLALRALSRDCMRAQKIKFWLGEDLKPYLRSSPNCAVIAIPYFIGQKIVGALGLLGPLRVPYDEIFSLLEEASKSISENLTRTVFKYKISYRAPLHDLLEIEEKKRPLLPEIGEKKNDGRK